LAQKFLEDDNHEFREIRSGALDGLKMTIPFTISQKHRLMELGAPDAARVFLSAKERDLAFEEVASRFVGRNRQAIMDLRDGVRRPILRLVEGQLVDSAVRLGFIEVATPTIISRKFIERMGIVRGSKLWNKIFWVDEKRCLRPMLAPNLYAVMGKLRRLWKPVRIFELGSCFRRETRGAVHLEEFTMFNFVELAPEKEPLTRLQHLIDRIMKELGFAAYELETKPSEVYGTTLDVRVDGVEVASAALGPKPMDENWGIIEPWIGAGFGVERLAMRTGKFNSITKVSKSLEYFSGAAVDIR